MLVRILRKRNTSPLLMGLKAGTTTLEISLVVPLKIGYSITWGPSYTTTRHISKRCSNTYNNKDTGSTMFIAALFTIARSWKEPRCPSTEECINPPAWSRQSQTLTLLPLRRLPRVEPSSLDHSIVQPLLLFLLLRGPWAIPETIPSPACHHLQLVPGSKDELAGMDFPSSFMKCVRQ